MFLCVTNSPIAHEIGKKIVSLLTDKTIVIDITTHNQNGSVEMEQILNANNIPYLECPVMGGPVQAEDGIRDRMMSRGLGDVYKRQHKNKASNPLLQSSS